MLLRRSTTIHARFFLTPTLFGTGSTSDAHLQHLGFPIDAARLCTISWSDWLLAPKVVPGLHAAAGVWGGRGAGFRAPCSVDAGASRASYGRYEQPFPPRRGAGGQSPR